MKIFTASEAAALLGVTRQCITARIRSGLYRAIRDESTRWQWAIPASELKNKPRPVGKPKAQTQEEKSQ